MLEDVTFLPLDTPQPGIKQKFPTVIREKFRKRSLEVEGDAGVPLPGSEMVSFGAGTGKSRETLL